MKTILVLTDFSDSALNACRYACGLAGTYQDCRIIMFHAFEVIADQNSLFEDISVEVSFEENMKYLNDTRMVLKPYIKEGTSIVCHTDCAPFEDAIESIIWKEQVDMVIIGTKGHSKTELLLTDSYTQYLMNKVPVPLLVIPSETEYVPIENIVLACELKKVENIPFDKIKLIINGSEAKFNILHINTSSHEQLIPQTILEQEKLYRLADELRPDYHYIGNVEIHEGIKRFIRDYQVNLLIMTHKNHGILHRILQGSKTRRMAMNSTIPLLILRENSEEN